MATTPQERLENDLKAAMKARERVRVATLRMLLTEVKNRRIELGEELSQGDFVALVKKAVKQRRDAAQQYREGQREELAAREEAEIELLEPYLPPEIDHETMRAAVKEYLAQEGLSGPQAMGQVMKAMMARFEGAADGKALSAIVREQLGS